MLECEYRESKGNCDDGTVGTVLGMGLYIGYCIVRPPLEQL